MVAQEQDAEPRSFNGQGETELPHNTESTQSTDTTIADSNVEKAKDSSNGNMTPEKDQRSSSSIHPIDDSAAGIPDGGLQAWLQVLGAHMLFFNSW